MKLLLVQAPAYGAYYPPLGIAYLSRYLRERKFDVEVMDLNVDFYNRSRTDPDFMQLWLCLCGWNDTLWGGYDPLIYFQVLFPAYFPPIQPEIQKPVYLLYNLVENWAKEILATGAEVIGFSVTAASLLPSLLMAMVIKREDKRRFVIFGGPDCARWNRAQFIIRTEWVDCVVIGEGEETLAEIMDMHEKKDPVHPIPGSLFYLGNGEVLDGGDRPLIEDLDSIPDLDFEGFEVDKYWMKSTLSVKLGRGCRGKCTFCEDNQIWYGYRARSPERVVGEIKYLKKRYGTEYFSFSGCIVNGSKRHLLRFCDLLLKGGLNIGWFGSARAIRMSDELLDKARASGCTQFNYGFESASQPVLNSMKKGYRLDHTRDLLIRTHERGIRILAMWLIGWPNEGEEDYKKTLDFIKEYGYGMTQIQFTCCNPIPGTRLYWDHADYGIVLPEYHREFPEPVRYCCDSFFPHKHAHTAFWHTKDFSNTYDLRSRRMDRAREFARSLNIRELAQPHLQFQESF
jgi:radical SAM superfamily enzyme YgiQ (UPF0313 family)